MYRAVAFFVLYSVCVCICMTGIWITSQFENVVSDLLSGLSRQYTNNASHRQMGVCVCLCVNLSCACDVCLHSHSHIHVNMSNLLWEHYCFLPYTFPQIPPATNVGLNYHQSIWLLIIQHKKKSWPCAGCYNRPRANSTVCVAWLHISVLRLTLVECTHGLTSAREHYRENKQWCFQCQHTVPNTNCDS